MDMKNKVILYIATSSDGFIAAKDGSVDFLDPYNNSGDDYGYKEFYDSIGTIVMGDNTYKQFGASAEFKEFYKGKPIFVFSRTSKGVADNVTFVSGDVKAFIKTLDENSGNIWLLGGACIAQDFLDNDLIDECIVTIMPDVLGDGIPLFKVSLLQDKFKLVEVKKFGLNVVQELYERA
jgi:dihydrofolate reductase